MKHPTRALAATVLVFEALVVLFASLVAKDLSGLSAAVSLGGGAALGATLVLAAGALRTRAGYVLGSLLQLVLLATALVVPAMLVVAAIFVGLWVAALLVGRRISSEPPPTREVG